MKLLVTGGAGFIGSNFVHYILREHPQWEIVNLDKLTYAGNLGNLADIKGLKNYRFIKGDIADRQIVGELLGSGIDVIVNFAAESHVDRSILDASPFIDTNIKGTQALLEGARQYNVSKFIQVSTDEVYGSIEAGAFNEESPLNPGNPYSASKASADLLCLAYWKTHHSPIVITRCTNNYGPNQFPEKLIPLAVTNVLEDKPVPIYGKGLNVRDWIFVIDHCRALEAVIERGRAGEIYNVAGDNQKTNLEVIYELLSILNKPRSLITFVTDRPGHDLRYALNADKIKNDLSWTPKYSFKEGMAITVDWYLKNEQWWRQVKSGEYATYYERMYSGR